MDTLFLGVSNVVPCSHFGFFAENQREHYIEHQREKQYMKLMIADLEIDTLDCTLFKRN